VKIGHGGQLIIGGFDPSSRDNYASQAEALDKAADDLRSLGVTSHEVYVRWNLCELEPGKYDWSVYDAFVDVYRRHHLKWVPFLIVGSAYSLPDWYYKTPESQGYVCLEHGKASDVESLWNPALRGHVSRFIEAFCEHYGPTGVIESILLGVTGNYGEAIYVATGNDWTASVHGEYHTHPGFWAGDPYAVKDFRSGLQREYPSIDALNKAWNAHFASFDEIQPFLREKAPNNRAWLDFGHWYINSMSEWSRFWMTETRKHFPGDIYLCTGGDARIEHGSNFGEQCKIAAEIGGGVRITNEGSDYAANYSLTRWVASAGRQYGAYFSFEPAGTVDANGVIARIYNATASGARGLHYYYPNLFDSEEAKSNFVRWGGKFKQRTPNVEVAVYYPQTSIMLKGGNPFLDYVKPLRDRFDFDFMSDEQILDGGLNHVNALILMWGDVAEQSVLRAIVDWVQGGGLVMYATGVGVLRTVEGDASWHEKLFGPDSDLGKGRVQRFYGDPKDPEYPKFLAQKLATAPELTHATKKMMLADGKEDKIFATLVGRKKILWLNYSESPSRKDGVTLAPMSIK
jgi:hypothetical protein